MEERPRLGGGAGNLNAGALPGPGAEGDVVPTRDAPKVGGTGPEKGAGRRRPLTGSSGVSGHLVSTGRGLLAPLGSLSSFTRIPTPAKPGSVAIHGLGFLMIRVTGPFARSWAQHRSPPLTTVYLPMHLPISFY